MFTAWGRFVYRWRWATLLGLDATVVRALMVPAVMRMLGQLNWWAPHLPRWLYQRSGLAGFGHLPVEDAA